MVVITIVAAEETLTVSGRLTLAGVGLFVLAVGLAMLLKPRWMSKPSKWQYKNAEDIEPSELTLILVRLFGVVWTIGATVVLVNAAFR